MVSKTLLAILLWASSGVFAANIHCREGEHPQALAGSFTGTPPPRPTGTDIPTDDPDFPGGPGDFGRFSGSMPPHPTGTDHPHRPSGTGFPSGGPPHDHFSGSMPPRPTGTEHPPRPSGSGFPEGGPRGKFSGSMPPPPMPTGTGFPEGGPGHLSGSVPRVSIARRDGFVTMRRAT